MFVTMHCLADALNPTLGRAANDAVDQHTGFADNNSPVRALCGAVTASPSPQFCHKDLLGEADVHSSFSFSFPLTQLVFFPCCLSLSAFLSALFLMSTCIFLLIPSNKLLIGPNKYVIPKVTTA